MSVLVGVILLEQLAVEQAFLRERRRKGILLPLFLVLLVGVQAFGVFLEIVHHRVTDGVGEGGLLPPEDILGQDAVGGERLAQQVLAHVVAVDLELGINAHDVLDEIEVAERHACLDGVDRDAAVGAEHVVHIQLVHALFRLLLEGLGRGREVRVLVAEELVGDLACHKHAHVGLLVDGLAAQVHAHARADGGDVVSAEHGNDLFERGEHLLARHDDLGVLGADEVGDLAGVLEVDGVKVHADGKGADPLAEELGGDGTDKAGIQTAGEQEAERRVGVEPLFHARDELLTDLFAYSVQIVA